MNMTVVQVILNEKTKVNLGSFKDLFNGSTAEHPGEAYLGPRAEPQ